MDCVCCFITGENADTFASNVLELTCFKSSLFGESGGDIGGLKDRERSMVKDSRSLS